MSIRRKGPIGPRIVAAAAIAAGVAGGILLPAPAAPAVTLVESRDALVPPPADSMRDAKSSAPYQLKEPSWLPEGVSLQHVQTSEEGAFSAGIWYQNKSGERVLHIWQTNLTPAELSDKDPAASGQGQPQSVDGKVWQAAAAPRGNYALSVLSRRFDDGITVSVDAVDGKVSFDDLRHIVQSIR